ncbi:MAG: OmpA family protein [Bacteroidota bacterium]
MSQTALWLLGLLGLVILAFACFAFHAPGIQADLQSRATAALAGTPGATASLDGLDVVLRGTVADEDARDQALAAAAAVPGVRRVLDSLTVTGGIPASDGSDTSGLAFALDRDGALVVRGTVPDEATRDAILARVRDLFPGQAVRDEITVSADADGSWWPAFDGVLAALAALPDGTMQFDGQTVVLRGTAASGEARAEVEAAARAALPEGFALRNEITVDAEAAAAAASSGDQVQSSGSTDADMQAAEAALREVLALGQIEFQSGTTTLTADSRALLDQAAEVFTTYPVLGAEVQGHSDSQGAEDTNLALSQRRAEAVRDYLVGQGVDTDALTPQGYGEAEPIADNDTEEGRARNRRVVFSLRAR